MDPPHGHLGENTHENIVGTGDVAIEVPFFGGEEWTISDNNGWSNGHVFWEYIHQHNDGPTIRKQALEPNQLSTASKNDGMW